MYDYSCSKSLQTLNEVVTCKYKKCICDVFRMTKLSNQANRLVNCHFALKPVKITTQQNG